MLLGTLVLLKFLFIYLYLLIILRPAASLRMDLGSLFQRPKLLKNLLNI